MTNNKSLETSVKIREQMMHDLYPAFEQILSKETLKTCLNPTGEIKRREKIYSYKDTILTMLVTATQEDKSFQNSVNIMSKHRTARNQELVKEEQICLEEEKKLDLEKGKKLGRPKIYRSKLKKSVLDSKMSMSTASYSDARKRIEERDLNAIFKHSSSMIPNTENWHGKQTFITDGTYLQLQDTPKILSEYPKSGSGEYPQALLQVLISYNTGAIVDVSIGNRYQSELKLVLPMIEQLPENSLLLADDLYNSYFIFYKIRFRQSELIVPGKRERTYRVVKELSPTDQLVSVSKPNRCSKQSSRKEWEQIPDEILMRRIEYFYSTSTGAEKAILWTTILDENIKESEIILKYEQRWNIEIAIREIKTIMDINCVRSKTPAGARKEILVALTAYNIVRALMVKSATNVAFSPCDENIFQKCYTSSCRSRIDKLGRVFFKTSPGRYGFSDN
jgi:hypothetical protein